MNLIDRLKFAATEGLLIFVKYGLIIILIIISVNYFFRVHQAAINGEQAAIAINEFIKKGWLPEIRNGQVPERTNDNQSSTNPNSVSK